MKTSGKGIKKEEWYSICSVHHEYTEGCSMCKIGNWNNVYKTKISSIFYSIFPKLWVWWVNLGNKKQKWLNHFSKYNK